MRSGVHGHERAVGVGSGHQQIHGLRHCHGNTVGEGHRA